MKQLETQFRKNGYDYEQVERGEYAVIYSLSFNGKIVGYEALKILSHNGRKIKGTQIPPKEYLPSTEQFGTLAFACRNLERAKIRFNELNVKSIFVVLTKAHSHRNIFAHVKTWLKWKHNR